jgi:hypothetical protein
MEFAQLGCGGSKAVRSSPALEVLVQAAAKTGSDPPAGVAAAPAFDRTKEEDDEEDEVHRRTAYTINCLRSA